MYVYRAWPTVLLGLAGMTTSLSVPPRDYSQPCRCFPGESCWPSLQQWDRFNTSVGGRLIATKPLASSCHSTFPGVSYDPDLCAKIQANWAEPELHDVTTSSPMATFFANASCDPFTSVNSSCVIGSYVPLAVDAASASDYVQTLVFANEHNIRLVIRNTGHDYMGKSTGAGALALWTHHLKDINVKLNYTSPTYSGPAMKMGAGVQAFEALAAANAQGYVVVHGDCPTIGLAGGYTQGGGTSPLSSLFGLGVDQVLEWEVVTSSGELLTATPEQNFDLYWALAGGGGGTFGVVLSMTVKMHPNMGTAGATLSFTETDSDKFWSVVQIFLMNLPALLDAGGTSYWQVLPGNYFGTPQTFLPNGTAADIRSLLKPTLDALDAAGISYSTYRYLTMFLCYLTNLCVEQPLLQWTTLRLRMHSTR